MQALLVGIFNFISYGSVNLCTFWSLSCFASIIISTVTAFKNRIVVYEVGGAHRDSFSSVRLPEAM